MDWLQHPALLWLIAATVLGIAELIVPGVFLVFIAIAAALTGVVTLLLPDLAPAGQILGFIAWSAVTVLLGRRWYREFPIASADPLLNDRVARLIGDVVTVVEPISDHGGRVRVGDGEWPARGPDSPAGTRVRITGAKGTTLLVEPLPYLPQD
ncbi:NfeD family protein [Sphingomonas elodea]|uniref:NfeD family protein n=1 Tax=Sphingomonas elodea TaxID=179878 RepID=UPI00026316F3|nr:NfeD family protein [Sphingomonas elodea]